jgi:hypothetical protein
MPHISFACFVWVFWETVQIYVPLGILLLGFAPKPSSGLSQASIFGASLGGLLLNIRDKHPCTYKVTTVTSATNSSEDAAASALTQTGTETISSIPTTDKVPENSELCQYYSRPLIDYDMALFLAPMEMTGAIMGVMVQSVLPNWLYLMTASLILAFTAKKTYDKWWETRIKEKLVAPERTTTTIVVAVNSDTEQQPSLQDSQDIFPTMSVELSPQNPLLPLLDDNSDSDEDPLQTRRQDSNAFVSEDDIIHDLNDMDYDQIARRDFLLERDARQYPTEKIFVFFVLWVGLTLLTFIKGGKGVDSLVGITCDNPWYGVLIAIQFLWTLCFAAYFGWKLLKDTKEKQSVGYPFHPQDVLWDFQKTRMYAFVTFVAGVVAGLVSR